MTDNETRPYLKSHYGAFWARNRGGRRNCCGFVFFLQSSVPLLAAPAHGIGKRLRMPDDLLEFGRKLRGLYDFCRLTAFERANGKAQKIPNWVTVRSLRCVGIA